MPPFAISWVNSTVGIMTAYSQQHEIFSFSKTSKIGPCAHAALYSMFIIILSWFAGGGRGCIIVLTTYRYPVPRLRIIGFIPLLHLYAFRDNFIIIFVCILYVSVTPGHFVRTSISLRTQFYRKYGKVLYVEWMFGFHFSMWTGLHGKKLQKLCAVAHLYGKFDLNRRR